MIPLLIVAYYVFGLLFIWSLCRAAAEGDRL